MDETYGDGLISLALDILQRKLVPPALFTEVASAHRISIMYPRIVLRRLDPPYW